MQRKQGRAAARCGRLGWEGAGSAAPGGGGALRPAPLRPIPPLALLLFSPFFSFLRLFSPQPELWASARTISVATFQPLLPNPGAKPMEPLLGNIWRDHSRHLTS